MKKFQTNLELFQKYAGEYDFDYLMIAAHRAPPSTYNDREEKGVVCLLPPTLLTPKPDAADSAL